MFNSTDKCKDMEQPSEEEYGKFLDFCSTCLKGENPKFLDLIKSRYAACDDRFRCSGEMVKLLEKTQKNMASEDSRKFVHLKEFLTKLKINTAAQWKKKVKKRKHSSDSETESTPLTKVPKLKDCSVVMTKFPDEDLALLVCEGVDDENNSTEPHTKKSCLIADGDVKGALSIVVADDDQVILLKEQLGSAVDYSDSLSKFSQPSFSERVGFCSKEVVEREDSIFGSCSSSSHIPFSTRGTSSRKPVVYLDIDDDYAEEDQLEFGSVDFNDIDNLLQSTIFTAEESKQLQNENDKHSDIQTSLNESVLTDVSTTNESPRKKSTFIVDVKLSDVPGVLAILPSSSCQTLKEFSEIESINSQTEHQDNARHTLTTYNEKDSIHNILLDTILDDTVPLTSAHESKETTLSIPFEAVFEKTLVHESVEHSSLSSLTTFTESPKEGDAAIIELENGLNDLVKDSLPCEETVQENSKGVQKQDTLMSEVVQETQKGVNNVDTLTSEITENKKCIQNLNAFSEVKSNVHKLIKRVPLLSVTKDTPFSSGSFGVKPFLSSSSKQENTAQKPSSSSETKDIPAAVEAKPTEPGDSADEFQKTDTDHILDKSQLKQKKRVAKLEHLLESLRDEIEKCQDAEMTLDDLDDDNAAYIYEDKLKRKFVAVWNKLCEVTGRTITTGRPTEKRVRYSGTRYQEINRRIEKFLNKKKVFPDFHDIKSIVKLTNKKCNLNLSAMMSNDIAREAFVDIGEMLQTRRHQDFIATFGTRQTDVLRGSADPYLTDPEFRRKVDTNRQVAKCNLDNIIAKYTKLQKERLYGEDEEEPEEESEEDEDNINRKADKTNSEKHEKHKDAVSRTATEDTTADSKEVAEESDEEMTKCGSSATNDSSQQPPDKYRPASLTLGRSTYLLTPDKSKTTTKRLLDTDQSVDEQLDASSSADRPEFATLGGKDDGSSCKADSIIVIDESPGKGQLELRKSYFDVMKLNPFNLDKQSNIKPADSEKGNQPVKDDTAVEIRGPNIKFTARKPLHPASDGLEKSKFDGDTEGLKSQMSSICEIFDDEDEDQSSDFSSEQDADDKLADDDVDEIVMIIDRSESECDTVSTRDPSPISVVSLSSESLDDMTDNWEKDESPAAVESTTMLPVSTPDELVSSPKASKKHSQMQNDGTFEQHQFLEAIGIRRSENNASVSCLNDKVLHEKNKDTLLCETIEAGEITTANHALTGMDLTDRQQKNPIAESSLQDRRSSPVNRISSPVNRISQDSNDCIIIHDIRSTNEVGGTEKGNVVVSVSESHMPNKKTFDLHSSPETISTAEKDQVNLTNSPANKTASGSISEMHQEVSVQGKQKLETDKKIPSSKESIEMFRQAAIENDVARANAPQSGSGIAEKLHSLNSLLQKISSSTSDSSMLQDISTDSANSHGNFLQEALEDNIGNPVVNVSESASGTCTSKGPGTDDNNTCLVDGHTLNDLSQTAIHIMDVCSIVREPCSTSHEQNPNARSPPNKGECINKTTLSHSDAVQSQTSISAGVNDGDSQDSCIEIIDAFDDDVEEIYDSDSTSTYPHSSSFKPKPDNSACKPQKKAANTAGNHTAVKETKVQQNVAGETKFARAPSTDKYHASYPRSVQTKSSPAGTNMIREEPDIAIIIDLCESSCVPVICSEHSKAEAVSISKQEINVDVEPQGKCIVEGKAGYYSSQTEITIVESLELFEYNDTSIETSKEVKDKNSSIETPKEVKDKNRSIETPKEVKDKNRSIEIPKEVEDKNRSIETPKEVKDNSSIETPKEVKDNNSIETPKQVKDNNSIETPKQVKDKSSIETPKDKYENTNIETPTEDKDKNISIETLNKVELENTKHSFEEVSENLLNSPEHTDLDDNSEHHGSLCASSSRGGKPFVEQEHDNAFCESEGNVQSDRIGNVHNNGNDRENVHNNGNDRENVHNNGNDRENVHNNGNDRENVHMDTIGNIVDSDGKGVYSNIEGLKNIQANVLNVRGDKEITNIGGGDGETVHPKSVGNDESNALNNSIGCNAENVHSISIDAENVSSQGIVNPSSVDKERERVRTAGINEENVQVSTGTIVQTDDVGNNGENVHADGGRNGENVQADGGKNEENVQMDVGNSGENVQQDDVGNNGENVQMDDVKNNLDNVEMDDVRSNGENVRMDDVRYNSENVETDEVGNNAENIQTENGNNAENVQMDDVGNNGENVSINIVGNNGDDGSRDTEKIKNSNELTDSTIIDKNSKLCDEITGGETSSFCDSHRKDSNDESHDTDVQVTWSENKCVDEGIGQIVENEGNRKDQEEIVQRSDNDSNKASQGLEVEGETGDDDSVDLLSTDSPNWNVEEEAGGSLGAQSTTIKQTGRVAETDGGEENEVSKQKNGDRGDGCTEEKDLVADNGAGQKGQEDSDEEVGEKGLKYLKVSSGDEHSLGQEGLDGDGHTSEQLDVCAKSGEGDTSTQSDLDTNSGDGNTEQKDLNVDNKSEHASKHRDLNTDMDDSVSDDQESSSIVLDYDSIRSLDTAVTQAEVCSEDISANDGATESDSKVTDKLQESILSDKMKDISNIIRGDEETGRGCVEEEAAVADDDDNSSELASLRECKDSKKEEKGEPVAKNAGKDDSSRQIRSSSVDDEDEIKIIEELSSVIGVRHSDKSKEEDRKLVDQLLLDIGLSSAKEPKVAIESSTDTVLTAEPGKSSDMSEEVNTEQSVHDPGDPAERSPIENDDSSPTTNSLCHTSVLSVECEEVDEGELSPTASCVQDVELQPRVRNRKRPFDDNESSELQGDWVGEQNSEEKDLAVSISAVIDVEMLPQIKKSKVVDHDLINEVISSVLADFPLRKSASKFPGYKIKHSQPEGSKTTEVPELVVGDDDDDVVVIMEESSPEAVKPSIFPIALHKTGSHGSMAFRQQSSVTAFRQQSSLGRGVQSSANRPFRKHPAMQTYGSPNHAAQNVPSTSFQPPPQMSYTNGRRFSFAPKTRSPGFMRTKNSSVSTAISGQNRALPRGRADTSQSLPRLSPRVPIPSIQPNRASELTRTPPKPLPGTSASFINKRFLSPTSGHIRSPAPSHMRSPAAGNIRSPTVGQIRSPNIGHIRSPTLAHTSNTFRPNLPGMQFSRKRTYMPSMSPLPSNNLSSGIALRGSVRPSYPKQPPLGALYNTARQHTQNVVPPKRLQPQQFYHGSQSIRRPKQQGVASTEEIIVGDSDDEGDFNDSSSGPRIVSVSSLSTSASSDISSSDPSQAPSSRTEAQSHKPNRDVIVIPD